MTTSVTCYTDRVMDSLPSSKKTSSPSLWRARRGRIKPWRGCGPRALNFSPLDTPPSLDAAGVARRSRAFTASPVGAGTALPSETRAGFRHSCRGAAAQTQNDTRHARYNAKSRGFRPRQSPARPKPRYNAKSRVDRGSTRVFAFSWRRGPAASNQGQKPA